MAARTLSWEQYQKLPLDKRRRPLTPAEYASLTQEQLEQAGLVEPSEGAPIDFGGRVFPNPTHIQVHSDTDPTIPVTRLPNGVEFRHENFQGEPGMDISNPAAADIKPEAMRTIGSDFSGKPVGSNATKTVPVIFADDDPGVARDVPFERMQEALHKGGKLGVYVRFKDDGGATRIVPSDRVQEASKNGGTVVPYGDPSLGEAQRSHGWDNFFNDLVGIGKAVVSAPGQFPLVSDPHVMAKQIEQRQAQAQAIVENSQKEKAAGYNTLYRVGAVPAQLAGANVPGMEQSAAEGDPGGVIGHAAAVPVALGAAELAHRVVGPAAAEYLETPGGKAAAAATEAALKKLPESAVRRIPYAGKVIYDVSKAASKAAKNARAAAETDLTGSNIDFAGETEPPPTPSSSTTSAEPETPMSAPAARAAKVPVKIQRQASALGPDATVRNQAAALGQVPPAAVEATPAAAPPAPATAQAPAAAAAVPPISPQPPGLLDIARGAQPLPAPLITPEEMGLTPKTEPPAAPGPPAAPAAPAERTIVIDPETGQPEFSDVVAVKGDIRAKLAAQMDAVAKQQQAEAAAAEQKNAAGPGEEDLSALGQQSLDALNAKRGGAVQTSADPKVLMQRWGVDPESLASGREQTRGMTPEQTDAYIDKLAEAYKNGRPVEPVMETRDADNNLIDVDGRARAVAAHRAGIDRIPIIVRRLEKVPTPQQ